VGEEEEMAVRDIVRLGHPALRTPAMPVDPAVLATPDLVELIDDMVETMRAAHGVGLAAPQVGIGLQLFVFGSNPDLEVPAESSRATPIPLTVVVNPMITPEAGEPVFDWEGCLSIPGLRGLVPRTARVRVRGLDRNGNPIDFTASGLAARIVQHEFDHLNGVVFLDRMRDLKTLAYGDEWERYLAPAPPAEEPALR
jgi:peptide deformylase